MKQFSRSSFTALLFALLCFSLQSFTQQSFAQPAVADHVYIIFDASGSMWGKLDDGSYKIHTARSVLEDFFAQDFGDTALALRAYGHRREGDCSDSELVIPFGQQQDIAPRLEGFLQDVNPQGKTPIHLSLDAALKDFGEKTGDIVLITDGIETCNADPCALMRSWRARDIDINVHVVGLGLSAKEKDALSCIAEEAGTPFYEADSAEELAEQLQSIQQLPPPARAFILNGQDADGNYVPVSGMLTAADGSTYEVDDNRRNRVPAGVYTLTAGVVTRNANAMYQPVSQTVTVAETGESEATVTVPVPARIKVTFMEEDEPSDYYALVAARQAEDHAFRFRSIDTVYVEEGTYEFSATLSQDNDLTVDASVRAGEFQEVRFDLLNTVRVYAQMNAVDSDLRLSDTILEMHGKGDRVYRIHAGNGKDVLPGFYTLKMDTDLYAYEADIQVTTEEMQRFVIDIPVGYVTVRYQKADGTADTPARVFISAEGKSRVYMTSDEPKALQAGTYTLQGWKQKGDYDLVTFDIVAGESKEVIVRAK